MERRRAIALATTTALIVGSGAVAAGATGALPILGFGNDPAQAAANPSASSTTSSAPDPDVPADTTDGTVVDAWDVATWLTPDPIYVTQYEYVDDIVVVPTQRPSESPAPTPTQPPTTEVPTSTEPPTTTAPPPPPGTDPAPPPPAQEPPVTTTPHGDDDQGDDHHDDQGDDHGDDHGDDEDDDHHGAGSGTTVCRSLKVEDDGTVHCED